MPGPRARVPGIVPRVREWEMMMSLVQNVEPLGVPGRDFEIRFMERMGVVLVPTSVHPSKRKNSLAPKECRREREPGDTSRWHPSSLTDPRRRKPVVVTGLV